ncbi:hypothetical protein [Arthrobacter sp. zg-Y1110]|uniref:zinc finger domain-containing protein n=1 Tax=Arthrobacter sp. zg-Y1110 TaxID=2886932 RepID=UPI001D152E76|nr:hypothetical protein [Arthrobacter sp. zg-Y1110]MCC3292418.1 hypothetical protein [Arthrobacter sp. zg-Y1110]UWX87146.1 hypothetical protein N2K99_17705 [Arthrobacter sp. zg-Y1110]
MAAEHGPADIYDTSGDGIEPKTAAEVAAAGHRAAEAAADFLQALTGCMTPMNLRPVYRDVEYATQMLERTARALSEAAQSINSGVPLALKFGDGEEPWTEARGGPVLSPLQILSLAKTAGGLAPEETTTYSAAIQELKPLPALIADKQKMEAREQSRAEGQELHDELLADMESRSCASCGAAPGDPCTAASGNLTGPHAARRHTSPLAAGHPEAAAGVRRVDPKFLHR